MPTIPFRVVLVAHIPKPRQPVKCRTICNSSVPGPNFTKISLHNGKGIVLLVSSKDAAVMPPYMDMALLSIKMRWTILNIPADIAQVSGEHIEGRSRDIVHCFKMFCIAHTEQWKACIFFGDLFYIYVRSQMGRVTSAHLEQRTSFLITAIAMRHAAREFHQQVQLC